MPGIAGALLPVHLLARDGDFRPILHVMRAGHALQELIAHHAVDQILARLQSEDGIAEFHLAGALGIERLDGRFHGFCSAGSAAPGGVPAWAPSALRNDPGFGASLGSARLTASRTNTQPPLVPGTAPRTSKSPLSLSVSTTSRLSVVTRSLPRWPAIFLPLNTLPGSWRWPVEPWLRCTTEAPCVARRPWKFQRFMAPWKPLPWLVPITSTICPLTKWSAVISAPTSIRFSGLTRNSASLRLGSTLATAKPCRSERVRRLALRRPAPNCRAV